jgi:hypothetical protein
LIDNEGWGAEEEGGKEGEVGGMSRRCKKKDG